MAGCRQSGRSVAKRQRYDVDATDMVKGVERETVTEGFYWRVLGVVWRAWKPRYNLNPLDLIKKSQSLLCEKELSAVARY